MDVKMQDTKLISIDPNVGSIGTNVLIKGDYLGDSINDIVSLFICGINCTSTIKWISTKCIKALVISNYKARDGIGEVILTTKSGGKCLSSLAFELHVTRVNILEESDFWIDEAIESILPVMDEKESVPLDTFEPDPLGIIKNKDSKGAKTKATINNIINNYGITGSASIFDENFSVNKFLVTRHYNTTWEEFKRGINNLRETLHIQQNKQESQSWLLNSSTVLVDMINGLHSLTECTRKVKFDSDELCKKFSSCYEFANNVFSSTLRQQQEMDKLKHTIKLIENYKYFFNLPTLFEKALQTKNYESAMANLKQVKVLMEPLSRKDEIMMIFHRYIELLINDIWEKLTHCTSFNLIKNYKNPKPEYLEKYIDRCTVSIGNSTIINKNTINSNNILLTSKDPITCTVNSDIVAHDNNFILSDTSNIATTIRKGNFNWKTYSDQLLHSFTQQKLLKFLFALHPNICHTWLYICQIDKNIKTLISNTENIFIAFHVRKIRQILNGSYTNYFTSNLSSSIPSNQKEMIYSTNGDINSMNDHRKTYLQVANTVTMGGMQMNSFGIDDTVTNSNGQSDDDILSSHVDSTVLFVINYCNNYYNEFCDWLCGCHFYVENHNHESDFKENYNKMIAMLIESLEFYFKTLSNMLFKIELSGNSDDEEIEKCNFDLDDDSLSQNNIISSRLSLTHLIKYNTNEIISSGNGIDLNDNIYSSDPQSQLSKKKKENQINSIKIMFISLLSYTQLLDLSDKISSIYRVLPNMVDATKYNEKKTKNRTNLLRNVINKHQSFFNFKLGSKLFKAKTDSPDSNHIIDDKSLVLNIDSNKQSVSYDNLNNDNNNNNNDNNSGSYTDVNKKNNHTIIKTFHVLMYEFCQSLFRLCTNYTCDRLRMLYQQETWIVRDDHFIDTLNSIHDCGDYNENSTNILFGNNSATIIKSSINDDEPIPTIYLDSNPFITVASNSSRLTQSNTSSQNSSSRRVSNSTKKNHIKTGSVTTQFPIDFHNQFIKWMLSVSYFMNPIIRSNCLEYHDVDQLKLHDSNIRKIFMLFYTSLKNTFNNVSHNKIIPNNFTYNNKRDTIYLMIYCNVAYMTNVLLPLVDALFIHCSTPYSSIVPLSIELPTLVELYDTFITFSNNILNQYVKVKFRSVLLPIIVSFTSNDGYLYSIHSNCVQSHIYNFMIRLVHFAKDTILFKQSTHKEVIKRLCNSVAVIIHDNVSKMVDTCQTAPHIVKQQIINITALQVIFRNYTDSESNLYFNESINKLYTLTNVDKSIISKTIADFTKQNENLLKAYEHY